jgi:lambda repressor-like predicted transcriptional regulator
MEYIQKIRNNLKHGDIAELSRRLGVSNVVINNHLSGKVSKVNKTIVDAAIDLIEEKRIIEQEYNNRLQQITT